MERKKTEEKSNRTFYILLILTLIVVTFSLVFFPEESIYEKNYDVYFNVIESGAGFDLNNTILTFGNVPRGGGAERKIVLFNNYNFPVEARVLITKNLDDFLIVDSNVSIESMSNYTLFVKLVVPENTELGNHSGTIKVKFYREV